MSSAAKPREWDADVYHRVSGPQEEWAREVVARLDLRGDETVLDAGCGTGRVTEQLLERLPSGRVIAVDGSEAMVTEAREHLGERADVRLGDLSELVLEERVDVIFSNAVFHWIVDHDRLFRVLHAALAPGGRLVAQCGGAGNIADVKQAIAQVADEDAEIGAALEDMPRHWNFATGENTEASLRAAGFSEARAWLAERPARPDEPREFMRTSILGPYLDRIRPELHDRLMDGVLERLGTPVVFDYVRLNIEAVTAERESVHV